MTPMAIENLFDCLLPLADSCRHGAHLIKADSDELARPGPTDVEGCRLMVPTLCFLVADVSLIGLISGTPLDEILCAIGSLLTGARV